MTRSPTLRSIPVAIAAVLLAVAAPLAAQSIASGSVHGVIKDSTGRPLGNVRVALTDRTSGFTYVALTPRAGRFSFQFLPPGEYDVLAERLGFLPVEVRGIAVVPAGQAEVDVTLLAVEPPVMERTVTAFGNRLDRDAAGPGWQLGGLELQRLADARRDLASAGRYSTIADDLLTIEGLPAPYSQTSVDGLAFRFPTHPLLGQTLPSGSAFPLSAFSASSVDPGGIDIEWTGSPRAHGRPRSARRQQPGDAVLRGLGAQLDRQLQVLRARGRGRRELPRRPRAERARHQGHRALRPGRGRRPSRDRAPARLGNRHGRQCAARFGRLARRGPHRVPRPASRHRQGRLRIRPVRLAGQPEQPARVPRIRVAHGERRPAARRRTRRGLGTQQKSWDLGLGATLTNVLGPRSRSSCGWASRSASRSTSATTPR
jgi:hypothetical protein